MLVKAALRFTDKAGRMYKCHDKPDKCRELGVGVCVHACACVCMIVCVHSVPEHQHKVPQEICSHQMYTKVQKPASCPAPNGNYYGKKIGIRFIT